MCKPLLGALVAVHATAAVHGLYNGSNASNGSDAIEMLHYHIAALTAVALATLDQVRYNALLPTLNLLGRPAIFILALLTTIHCIDIL